MMDANAAGGAILLIRLGAPAEPASSPAGMTQAHHEEQLAFLKAALLDSGQCHGTWIGDNALIGVFPSADSAFGVACSVQQAGREHGRGSLLGEVRILLDTQAGDPIDEAVSSPVDGIREPAEQLMRQIPPGQIFATGAITGQLSEASRDRFRLYEQDAGGTGAGTRLCQITCNEETLTRIAIPTQYQERAGTPPSLRLRWRENALTVLPESPSLTIGRGDQSDIRIESAWA